MKKASTRGRRVILSIDVGGSHVKVMTDKERIKREFESGPGLTAKAMVRKVEELVQDWSYDVVSVGYPGVVVRDRPSVEPVNLGRGWKGYDFAKAFGRPTKVVNDALMQALGSYDGGKMLFLGLGTGLGSAMIANGALSVLATTAKPGGSMVTRSPWLIHTCSREPTAHAPWNNAQSPAISM